jgi:hypothetical protein
MREGAFIVITDQSSFGHLSRPVKDNNEATVSPGATALINGKRTLGPCEMEYLITVKMVGPGMIGNKTQARL